MSQNLCPRRDHFLVEKDKNRWVEMMPAWIKHVRHRFLSSGLSNWTQPKFLPWLEEQREGPRKSSMARKSGNLFSGKEKVQIQFPHPLYSPSPPPSKQANFSHWSRSVESLFLSSKWQTMTGPRTFPLHSEAEAYKCCQVATDFNWDLEALKDRQ